MNRGTLRARLKGRLGIIENTRLDDDINNEIDHVIKEILEQEAELPWFLVTESSLQTVIGQEYLALPDGFLLEVAELATPMFYLDSDGTYTMVPKSDLGKLRVMEQENIYPQGYTLLDKIYIGPIPQATWDLRYWHYTQDTDLVDDGDENNWLKYASDLILNEVGIVIAGQYEQSQTKPKQFAEQAARARRRLDSKNVEWIEQMRQSFLGGTY